MKKKKYKDFFDYQLAGIAYFYGQMIPALVGYALRYGLPFDNDLIDAMKESMENHFWDGVEPEWNSMETCNWWEKMNIDYFLIDDNQNVYFKPEYVLNKKLA